jgi:basic membrane lipoprotein Med (substrate-binding protein (PBP1-ABC) superfamily)
MASCFNAFLTGADYINPAHPCKFIFINPGGFFNAFADTSKTPR